MEKYPVFEILSTSEYRKMVMLRAGRSVFDFGQRKWSFLFLTAFRPALGPTQPPIYWVPVVISSRVERQGCEASHSPPSSDEVKNGGAIPSLPHICL
jgi:hypothetical protein